MSEYLTEFQNREDIIAQFGADEDALEGATIHLAWYGYGSYCGSALVVYEKNGKLYEVNGSHCSCYGLEGQWEPEETSWEALTKRTIYDEYDGAQEAMTKLQALVTKHLKPVPLT